MGGGLGEVRIFGQLGCFGNDPDAGLPFPYTMYFVKCTGLVKLELLRGRQNIIGFSKP